MERLLFVVLLARHATLAEAFAHLLSARFALLFELLKLRPLCGREHGDDFVAQALSGFTKLRAERRDAGLLFGGQGRARTALLDEAAHLFALGLRACFEAFADSLNLLLLRVVEIEFGKGTLKLSACAAHTMFTPTPHPLLAFAARVAIFLRGRARLLLRYGGGGRKARRE